jgi:hypothetical protein
MDASVLLLSLIFGLAGMGLFMYGRSEKKYVHLSCGLALMLVPYFIPHALVLCVVCVIVGVVPFVFARST